MSRRRYTSEQIIGMLRERKWIVPCKDVGQICRDLGISEQTYTAGGRSMGMKVTQARRLEGSGERKYQVEASCGGIDLDS